MASAYDFPIFIASTHYDLVDLRAQLAQHLNDLGYRSVLSSESGFPDRSPGLEPWESCLEVLNTCFIVLVIIDGSYGKRLPWPHFGAVMGDEHLSPTHGEYRYAHKTGKRMLVFIRRGLMEDYSRFREASQTLGSPEEVKSRLFLPSRVDYDSLLFVKEAKSTAPIPWICEFDNVTQVAAEVQRRLLNELAREFHFRQGQLEAVLSKFGETLDALPPDKRKEALERIGVTKQMMDDAGASAKKLGELEKKLKETEGERDLLQKTLGEGKKQSNEVDALKKQVAAKDAYAKKLAAEIAELKPDRPPSVTSGLLASRLGMGYIGVCGSCDRCGKEVPSKTGIFFQALRQCPVCKKNLCAKCWPRLGFVAISDSCPKCSKSNFIGGPVGG